MRLLAIDTATPRIVAGIVEVSGDRVTDIATRSHAGATAHAEILAPSIAEVADEAGMTLAELDGVVTGLGPGPFTGLRVGIVTAAALGDALGLPVWGVCSLDALAPDAGSTLVVTDARRKEVYVARYDGVRRVFGPAVLAPADLVADAAAVDRVIHAGADKYLDVIGELGPVSERFPTPSGLVEVALRDGLVGGASTALQPIYIRRPDAAEPKARPALDTIGPTGR